MLLIYIIIQEAVRREYSMNKMILIEELKKEGDLTTMKQRE
jgi:hypothetical protein